MLLIVSKSKIYQDLYCFIMIKIVIVTFVYLYYCPQKGGIVTDKTPCFLKRGKSFPSREEENFFLYLEFVILCTILLSGEKNISFLFFLQKKVIFCRILPYWYLLLQCSQRRWEREWQTEQCVSCKRGEKPLLPEKKTNSSLLFDQILFDQQKCITNFSKILFDQINFNIELNWEPPDWCLVVSTPLESFCQI